MWVCVCQGQARVGSVVSEGLYLEYSQCDHVVHAVYITGRSGRPRTLCHKTNDSSHSAYRAALLPQTSTDAKDGGPL